MKITLLAFFCIFTASTSLQAADPFIDESEFEAFKEQGSEKKHINFFRHGRFFDVGLLSGYTGFTQGYSQVFKNYIHVGAFINYFIDLRISIYYNLSYGKGLYKEQKKDENIFSSTSLSFLSHSIGLRYYINPEKIILSVSQLNPYLFLGLNYFSLFKPVRQIGEGELPDPNISNEHFPGGHVGLGFEFPIVKKKIHLALELSYQLFNSSIEGVNFNPRDDNTGSPVETGILVNGDTYSIQVLFGAQF